MINRDSRGQPSSFVTLFVSGLVVSLFLGEKIPPWGKTSRALGRSSVGGELAGLELELGVTAVVNHAKSVSGLNY